MLEILSEVSLAFLQGMALAFSPCILPVLPLVLAGGVTGDSRRPFGIIAGFIVSFTVFALAARYLLESFGIAQDTVQIVSYWLILAFGLVMVVPVLEERFAQLTQGLASKAQALSTKQQEGFKGGIFLGVLIGIVWTPCAGGLIASVLLQVLQAKTDAVAALNIVSFSSGVALPMLVIALTGKALVQKFVKYTVMLRRAMGVTLIVFAGLGIAGVNIGVLATQYLPSAAPQVTAKAGELQNALPVSYPAPDFSGISQWINTPPLRTCSQHPLFSSPSAQRVGEDQGEGGAGVTVTPHSLQRPKKEDGCQDEFRHEARHDKPPHPDPLPPCPSGTGEREICQQALRMEALKGKVVLVDFWTYSCINCLRTLPYLKDWYAKYHDKGFEIVGVHSPEFAFERKAENVENAVKRHEITYPVAMDNDFKTWFAYKNEYWPAHYLIDRQGRVVYTHFGEGHYDITEHNIQALLGLEKTAPSVPLQKVTSPTQTPETYLGTKRDSREWTGSTGSLPLHHWRLDGAWDRAKEKIISRETGDTITLRFRAKKVFLVMAARTGESATAEISVDQSDNAALDVKDGRVTIGASRLYELVSLPKTTEEGTVRIKMGGAGIEAYAFTFESEY